MEHTILITVLSVALLVTMVLLIVRGAIHKAELKNYKARLRCSQHQLNEANRTISECSILNLRLRDTIAQKAQEIDTLKGTVSCTIKKVEYTLDN